MPSVKFDNPQEIPTITIMDFDDRAHQSTHASPSAQPLLNEESAPSPPSNGKLPHDSQPDSDTKDPDFSNVANGTVTMETDEDVETTHDEATSEEGDASVTEDGPTSESHMRSDDVAVLVENGYFAWDESGSDECLKEITVKIPKGV